MASFLITILRDKLFIAVSVSQKRGTFLLIIVTFSKYRTDLILGW